MPAEFQRAMNYTHVGLQNTYCLIDDIIIVGTGSESDHIIYVTNCLKKLDEDILIINLQKFQYAKTVIEWLWYKFTETGISPLENKTAPISPIYQH